MPRELSSAFQHQLPGQSPSEGRVQTDPSHQALPLYPRQVSRRQESRGLLRTPAKNTAPNKMSGHAIYPIWSSALGTSLAQRTAITLRSEDAGRSPRRLGPPRDPGDSAVIPRGGAPFGPRHMEPQVFVSRAAAPSGKTRSQNVSLVPRLWISARLSQSWRGLGRGSSTRRRALPGIRAPLTGAGAQPVPLRRGLGPRRGARGGRPGQVASRAPGSVQTRPAWPPAGSPGHRRLCASGEEGGAARHPSHSKATRSRGSGSVRRAQGVQGGDPQP